MSIKDRIKEARLNKKYTQEQLATLIGVAKSTVTGYEKGNSEPSIEIMGKIMGALDVDANYLWQDETDFPMQVSYDEMQHIKKYRDLDGHGKEMVDFTLEKEYERCLELAPTTKSEKVIRFQEASSYEVNAANAIPGAAPEDVRYDDDIMDDENF